jgi:hypothetical protein
MIAIKHEANTQCIHSKNRLLNIRIAINSKNIVYLSAELFYLFNSLFFLIFIFFILQQIVDDSLNLARANILNYSLALETIQYLEKETHYIPWLAAYNNLGFIVNRFTAKDSPLIKVSNLRIETIVTLSPKAMRIR